MDCRGARFISDRGINSTQERGYQDLGIGSRETMTDEEEFELSENRLEEITKEVEG
jgi:hypothetical protein